MPWLIEGLTKSSWRNVQGYFSHGSHPAEEQRKRESAGNKSIQWYLLPYLRLTRANQPIGFWIIFWPFSWSIALATSPGHLPSIGTLSQFGAFTFVMRGAGCVINDMCDRDVDARVGVASSRHVQVMRVVPGNLLYMAMITLLCNSRRIVHRSLCRAE